MDKPIDEQIKESGMEKKGTEKVTDTGAPQQALGFVRRHPVLTVLGTAGAGLLGGLELAFGVVLGAGVAALVGKRGSQVGITGEGGAHGEGVSAREKLARMSPELQKRMRAILQAAQGRLAPAGT
jgi:hypothetical protein